jgi:hypothetical protein
MRRKKVLLCNTCSARGWVKCKFCDGFRSIHNYYNCIRELTVETIEECYIDILQPDDPLNMYLDFVKWEHLIVDQTTDSNDYPKTIYSCKKVNEVNSKIYEKLIARLQESNNKNHVLKEIKLFKGDFILVNYKFGSDNYKLIIDPSKEKVFSITSPFSILLDNLMKEAIKTWRNGNKGAA